MCSIKYFGGIILEAGGGVERLIPEGQGFLKGRLSEDKKKRNFSIAGFLICSSD